MTDATTDTTTIDLRRLQRGDALPAQPLRITAADVAAYLAATGETGAAAASLHAGTVPPLAVGAFALAALLARMPLVAGTLHAGQEFEFHRAVVPGEALTVHADVAQRAERAGSVLTALALEVRAADGALAVSGRATIVFPAEDPGTAAPPAEARA